MALTVVRDYRTAAGISRENNFHIETVAGARGPSGEPVLRLATTNADTGGASSGMENRRNDGQIGQVPLQAVRANRMFYRVDATPPNIQRWLVPGSYEIHGNGLPQAPVMPSIGKYADGLWIEIDANAGVGPHRYFKLRKVTIGEWLAMQFTIFYTHDGTGWWRMEVNGVVVAQVRGQQTTGEASSGYWKYADYGAAGNWSQGGSMTYSTSGGHILDGDPGVGTWVMPGTVPDPTDPDPPPPVPVPVNTKPSIEIITPKSDFVAMVGKEIEVVYKVHDDSAVQKGWIGYVDHLNQNRFVTLDKPVLDKEIGLKLPAPVVTDGGFAIHFYGACEDDKALAATPVGFDLLVKKAVTPPPPPTEPLTDEQRHAASKVKTNQIRGNAKTTKAKVTLQENKDRQDAIVQLANEIDVLLTPDD